MYFVLALGMFPQLGYLRVWGKLTAGLSGLGLPRPSEKALRDLRRRVGPAPLKVLFEVVAGPLAQPHTPGVCFAGLRTVAFDGLNSVKVPDTSRNRAWLGKIRHRLGLAGYPALRIMALAETGTRGLLGAAAGSVSDRDETGLARRLLHLLHPGMLVLPDRGFDGAAFFSEITATGAMLLARAKSTRKPLVLVHLPDGDRPYRGRQAHAGRRPHLPPSRHGRGSAHVVALSATGQLGMVATGQVPKTADTDF